MYIQNVCIITHHRTQNTQTHAAYMILIDGAENVLLFFSSVCSEFPSKHVHITVSNEMYFIFETRKTIYKLSNNEQKRNKNNNSNSTQKYLLHLKRKKNKSFKRNTLVLHDGRLKLPKIKKTKRKIRLFILIPFDTCIFSVSARVCVHFVFVFRQRTK